MTTEVNHKLQDGVTESDTTKTAPDYKELARIFKALGHATRLGLLAKAYTGEFCVADLQEHLDRSQANVSQHLAVLRDRGLAIPQRRGNNVCYYLADERVVQIIDLAAKIVEAMK